MEAALFAAPLVRGGAASAGIRRSTMFGWLHRETPRVKSDLPPLDVAINKNDSQVSTGNWTKVSSSSEIDISSIQVGSGDLAVQSGAQDPAQRSGQDSAERTLAPSKFHHRSDEDQHESSRARVLEERLAGEARQSCVVESHQQGYGIGLAEGHQQGWALGYEQGRSEGIGEAESASMVRRVTLYLPELINGIRVLHETQQVGHYLVEMSALHGGPGASIAFRNSRSMEDHHSEVAVDRSVLTGTLRNGWLETELELKPEGHCAPEFNDGHSRGFNEGHHSGFMDGHKQGAAQGTEHGYSMGFAEGVQSGQRSWYLEGYVHGYNGVEFDSPTSDGYNGVEFDSATSDGAVERSAIVIRIADGQGYDRNGFDVSEAAVAPSQAEECRHSTADVTRGTIEDGSGPADVARHQVLHILDHLPGRAIALLCASHLLCVVSAMCRCRQFIRRGSLHGAYDPDVDESRFQDSDAAAAAALSKDVTLAYQQAECECRAERPLCISDEDKACPIQSVAGQFDGGVSYNDVDVVELCTVQSDLAPNLGVPSGAEENSVDPGQSAARQFDGAAACSDRDAATTPCFVQSDHAEPAGAGEDKADPVPSSAGRRDGAAACDDCDATEAPTRRIDCTSGRGAATRVQALVQRFEMQSPCREQEMCSPPRGPPETCSPTRRTMRRSCPATSGNTDISVVGWQEWEARLDKLGGAFRCLSPRTTEAITPRHTTAFRFSTTP